MSGAPEQDPASGVSPDLFLRQVFAYQQTAAIKAAVDLDLFSALGDSGGTAAALAERCGASARGVRILCDYLTVQGLLTKDGGLYRRTPSTAVFLDRRSPAWMGSVIDFLASPELLGAYLTDPAGYVRNGGSAGLASIAPENPVWIKFARAMSPFMAPVAEGVAAFVKARSLTARRVLDIAAGHGLFGIAIAKAVADAQVTGLDWPQVVAIAAENAQRSGVGERYRTLGGSAFDVDWGRGWDLVLMPNFLHHFDAPTCETLLRRARESLEPGGHVILVEMMPDEDRISPPFPAVFAFVMLGNTPSGDAYTRSDFDAMRKAAGFRDMIVQPLPPSPQTLLALVP